MKRKKKEGWGIINMKNTLNTFYDKQFLKDIESNLSDDILFGNKTGKYKKEIITKYLSIFVPTIKKQYDEDTGEFVGFLFTMEWIQTNIPIGKEVIKVPIRKKMKNQNIKFKKYSPIDPISVSPVS